MHTYRVDYVCTYSAIVLCENIVPREHDVLALGVCTAVVLARICTLLGLTCYFISSAITFAHIRVSEGHKLLTMI